MAARRRTFVPKDVAPSAQHLYAAFIGDLFDGRIEAEALVEVRDGRGNLINLLYEEPAPRARVASVAANEPVQKAAPKRRPRKGAT